jgi:hypothetical protein
MSGEPDASERAAPLWPAGPRTSQDRLVGRLVHRLFQRRLDPSTPAGTVAAEARRLVRPEERVDVLDEGGLAASAAHLYVRLRAHAELAAILQSGPTFYEVPFSMVPPGGSQATVRGTIDCLVIPADDVPLVVEFKTGAPRPEHEAQVARYAEAVRTIFANNTVKSRIFYA